MFLAQATPPVSEIKDIVAFGLLFVMSAALANGLSVPLSTVWAELKANRQASILALVGNFLIIPALVVGGLLALDLSTQVTISFALLSLVAGAPFVAWMTSLGKGDIGYGAALSLTLLIVTIAVMPLVLPGMLSTLDTDVTISAWRLYWPMLLFIGLPLVIGFLVRARHPDAAATAASYLGPLSIAFLLVHVVLMFATFWSDFTDEFGTGDMAFTLGFAIVPLLVGYLLCPPYVLAPVKAPDSNFGVKLASTIGTAQKGSQPLICSLIVAFGAYSVSGVVALASSVVTIIIVILYSLEVGRRHTMKEAAAGTPAPTSPAPAAAGDAP
jgi:predicted Na+-dependent transporter